MPELNLNGRVLNLSTQQYSRAVKRQKELTEKGRRLSRELGREGPRGHRNSFSLVTTSQGDLRREEETDTTTSWKVSKQLRIHEEFDRQFSR